MRKYLLTAFILIIIANCFGQNLQKDWENIINCFNKAEYDSVLIKIDPFIKTLEKGNFNNNLFTAYYYKASSFALNNNLNLSDSMFCFLENFAVKNNLNILIPDLKQKQVVLYSKLYYDSCKNKDINSLIILNKAVKTAEDNQLFGFLPDLYYERALYFESQKQYDLMSNDLLKIIELNKNTKTNDSLLNSAKEKLAKFYLNNKQYSQVENLNLNKNSNLELNIQKALEEENKGDYANSDKILSNIQKEVFYSFSNNRIIDFIKKRYNLYEKRNLSKSAADTIRTQIAQLEKLNKTPDLIFCTQEFLISIFLYNGEYKEADQECRKLKIKFDQWNLDQNYQARFSKMMGDIAYLNADLKNALKFYEEAEKNSTFLTKNQLYELLNNLSLAYVKTNNSDKALNNFVKIYNDTKNSDFLDIHYKAGINLGLIYIKKDQLPSAVKIFDEIRQSSSQKNLFSLYISASMRLAEIYQMQGFYTLSDNIFYEIENKKNYLQNPFELTQTLISLSDYYFKNKNYKKATDFINQADLLAQNNNLLALNNLICEKQAQIFFDQNIYDKARFYYEKIAKYYNSEEDSYNYLNTRLKIALTLLSENNYAKSEQVLNETIKNLYKNQTPKDFIISEDLTYIDLYCKANIYLASVHFLQATQQDNLILFMQSYKEINNLQSFMDNNRYLFIHDSQSDSEKNNFINVYKLKMDIAVTIYNKTQDNRYLETAFEMSEKARSQSFINEAGSQLISKLSNPKLKNNQKTEIAFLDNKNNYALETADGLERGIKIISSGPQSNAIKSNELSNLQRKYDDLINSLKDDKSIQLVDVNILSLNSVQNTLYNDEILLNYYVSGNNCYLFVITKNQYSLFTIEKNYHEISNIIDSYRSQLMLTNNNDYLANSKTLYDILIKPAEQDIINKKIIIIPSGKLNNLPFSSLSDGNKFLIKKNQISELPNISILQFINLKTKKAPKTELLVLGNPNNPIASRLPGTETETQEIKKIFPQSTLLIGDVSSKTNLLNAISNKNIIHFATHGLFEPEYPLLSGLLLTPESNKDDGILRLFEIYNLNLTSTELVVLSACETGLAKIKQNDDVIGLVRGFFFAGSSNVIASLWKVNDTATSKLMINFYSNVKNG
jgi:CHAT domain-containing protein